MRRKNNSKLLQFGDTRAIFGLLGFINSSLVRLDSILHTSFGIVYNHFRSEWLNCGRIVFGDFHYIQSFFE